MKRFLVPYLLAHRRPHAPTPTHLNTFRWPVAPGDFGSLAEHTGAGISFQVMPWLPAQDSNELLVISTSLSPIVQRMPKVLLNRQTLE